MVTVKKFGDRWVCECGFVSRHIPKAAGFWWDPVLREWYTTSAIVAARLQDAEKMAAAKLAEDLKYRLDQAKYATSSAAAAELDIPTRPGNVFLPYQVAGVAGLDIRLNCLLADDPGLGKTIQVCGLMNLHPEIRKVLIVCPLSLSINWSKELRKWLVHPYRTAICNATWFRPEAVDISIIHYDVLLKHVQALRWVAWDLVVADECHLLKNQGALRTRSLLGIDAKTANRENKRNDEKYEDEMCLWRRHPGEYAEPRRKAIVYPLEPVRGKRNVFLTGTPLPNRPREGWPIFHHLDPVEFKSHSKFKTLYCGGVETEFGFDDSGHSNLQALQRVLRSTIMIRRLKKNVLKDLPAKRRVIIEIPHSNKQTVEAELAAYVAAQAELRKLKEEAAAAKGKDNQAEYAAAVGKLKKARVASFELISKQRHQTGLATLPYLLDHIHSIIADEKVIVFLHHVDMIEAVVGEFGKKCVAIYGPVPATQRQTNVDRFQTDPTCRIAVGNYGPMGTGWTLTAASRVVAGELDWVPGNMTQAEDRAHRIGQHDMVLVEHLVLEGSLAAYMAQKVVEKQAVQTAALDMDVPDVDLPASGAAALAQRNESVARESATPAKEEAPAPAWDVPMSAYEQGGFDF